MRSELSTMLSAYRETIGGFFATFGIPLIGLALMAAMGGLLHCRIKRLESRP